MTATHQVHSITKGPRLHLAFELSWNQWKLAFTVGMERGDDRPRRHGTRCAPPTRLP